MVGSENNLILKQTKTVLEMEPLFTGTCTYAQEVVLDQSLSMGLSSILPSENHVEGKFIKIMIEIYFNFLLNLLQKVLWHIASQLASLIWKLIVL